VSGLALRVAQSRHKCGARVRASAQPAWQPCRPPRAQARDCVLRAQGTPRRGRKRAV